MTCFKQPIVTLFTSGLVDIVFCCVVDVQDEALQIELRQRINMGSGQGRLGLIQLSDVHQYYLLLLMDCIVTVVVVPAVYCTVSQ